LEGELARCQRSQDRCSIHVDSGIAGGIFSPIPNFVLNDRGVFGGNRVAIRPSLLFLSTRGRESLVYWNWNQARGFLRDILGR